MKKNKALVVSIIVTLVILMVFIILSRKSKGQLENYIKNPEGLGSPDEPGSWRNMDQHLLAMLKKMSKETGPIQINSGYRSATKNRAAGGVKNSSHLTGHAVDLGGDPVKLARAAWRAGFRRIGVGGSFVHLDNDSSKPDAFWTYPGSGFSKSWLATNIPN